MNISVHQTSKSIDGLWAVSTGFQVVKYFGNERKITTLAGDGWFRG